ncbi:MAG: hypothetical protein H7A23_24650 [Leptospiraceae bacterium]|nr:hypothetical protein [Leptospiraceae bacterium]MCP5497756.1 hypothetical protein [Leptospiraceae bacterium]
MANFSIQEIQGQDHALRYVEKYLQNTNRIPPLLIFYGPDGVGKWSLAERFSFHLLCLNSTGCGLCPSCKAFLSNSHPDYIVFPSDSKIAIGEEKEPSEFTIRWLIAKRINFQPHLSQFRIVLFPDASLINNEAETALLKSLEEAPKHTKFIFIVNNLSKLKQTIISRGICVPFYYLKKSLLKEVALNKGLYLEEFFGGSLNPYDIPGEVIQLSKEMVETHIHDSIALLQLENWLKMYKDTHPEWKEDFNYTTFLDLVGLILIYYYSQNNYDQNIPKINCVFEFKQGLIKNIANLEPYLLSKLFYQLCNLT